MTNKTNIKKHRKIILFAVIIILAVVNGVTWFWNKRNEQQLIEEIENEEMELFITLAKLDSIAMQLGKKIDEITILGGRVDSLVAIQEQLATEKAELRAAKSLTQEHYHAIKEKVEGYEILLRKKDQEIAKIKQVNQVLLDENTSLKEKENTLIGQISSLKVVKDELREKMSAATLLRTINIIFKAINSKGKIRKGVEFRVREVEKIRIGFGLEKNDLAEVGTKKIYLLISEPEGAVLYNPAAGSGTFTINNAEKYFTAQKELLFDNTEQYIEFEYDKGSEFKKGQYEVTFYCAGEIIGKSTFIIK